MRALLLVPAVVFFSLPILSTICNVAKQRAAEKRRAAVKAAATKRLEEARAAEQTKRAAAKAIADAEKERRRIDRERKQAEKLQTTRKLAEYKERALAAQRELKALERNEAKEAAAPSPVALQRETKEEAPAPVTPEDFAAQFAASAQPAQTFKGQRVAFTGKLPGMTRAEAIKAVQVRGGAAFDKMPASTTLLVVGANPGIRKMDKADELISQVKKITAEQFMTMIAA